MGNSISNLNEKINAIFIDKYVDYLDLMKVAGCTEEEIASKNSRVIEFEALDNKEKANVVKDDMTFLGFFSNGGVSDGELYYGINKEVSHSIICDMSSLKKNVEIPKEYQEDIDGPDQLPFIRDMVSGDMTALFPDIKKMFFLGQKDLFNRRMNSIFDNEELTRLNDIIDNSVNRKGEAGIYEYMDMINEASTRVKNIELDKKTKNYT